MTKEESAIEVKVVAYGMTIGDNQFGNRRPGVVEATLKPGKTLEDALDELDDRLNAWHRKRYPHLYPDEPKDPEYAQNLGKKLYQEIRESRQIPTISKDKEKFEILIDNSQSIEELQAIKDDCWKHGLSTNYIMKFNELNNGRPSEFSEGLDKSE